MWRSECGHALGRSAGSRERRGKERIGRHIRGVRCLQTIFESRLHRGGHEHDIHGRGWLIMVDLNRNGRVGLRNQGHDFRAHEVIKRVGGILKWKAKIGVSLGGSTSSKQASESMQATPRSNDERVCGVSAAAFDLLQTLSRKRRQACKQRMSARGLMVMTQDAEGGMAPAAKLENWEARLEQRSASLANWSGLPEAR